MRKIKFLLLVAILGVASTVLAKPQNTDYKKVINAFIESRINTDYKTMKTILSEDAVEKLPRVNMTYKSNAADLLKIMKSNDGVQQGCTSSYKILAESSGMIMVHIDFIYQQQIVSEFLTLERSSSEEWKVTQINKFFKLPSDVSVG